MGGIATDAHGRTSIEGLWAAGEAASTGVHGANRLASNSLLEAVVFAARVADDINESSIGHAAPARAENETPLNAETPDREPELRKLMTAHVGVIRNEAGLARALATIINIERDAPSVASRNMTTTALLIAAAAWRRRESRGAHFRSDYPKPDAGQAHRSFITLEAARALADDAARASDAAAVR